MGKKIAIIVLAVAALLSCENPVQSGLGDKVDINRPTITMTSPANIGAHVRGKLDLVINAQDDIEVSTVRVAITKDSEGNLITDENLWTWIPATLDPETGRWTSSVDTTEYPDGELPIMVKALDGTGKSVIFEAMYSVKNGPPEIELQIPASAKDPDRPNLMKELVTGGYMLHIAKDLWGIAPGYPKIQFWPASQGDNPVNAEWQDMDEYAGEKADVWQNSPTGLTAMQFKFYAVDRNNPNPDLDIQDWPSLPTGQYRFRFQVKDVEAGSQVVYYPPQKSSPEAKEFYEVELIAARELPLITMAARAEGGAELEGQYHRDPFYIAAEVSHTTGIIEATIEVQKEGDPEATLLARQVYSENDIAVGSGPDATLKRILESYLIKPGEAYIHSDVANTADNPDNQNVHTNYSFGDGVYTFTVRTTSKQTSRTKQSLTIYIDTTPPEIDITRIQPNVEARNPGSSGLNEYTVNGFIAADMSSYDANNIGVVEDPNGSKATYREIKYLMLDAYNPAADPRALYENPAAHFFDNPAAPVYKRAGSTASVIINTTALVPKGSDYYKNKDQYLHFIAKDKAGNYSFSVALLKVDQSTDIPGITIMGFDFNQRSQADLDAAASPNKLVGSERILSGTFSDDDGVLVGNTPGENIQFQIYQDGGDPELKASITVTMDNLDIINEGKAVNFRVTLPPHQAAENSAAALPDGTYSVEIVISDDVKLKNGLKPAPALSDLPAEINSISNTDTGDQNPKRRVYFVLDTQPPEISEEAIGSTDVSPRLVAGSFKLEGRLFDINGLKSLKVTQTEEGAGTKTIFEKTFIAPDNRDEPWVIPNLPQARNSEALDLRPGSFAYEIIAEDVARQTRTLIRDVVVDTVPPEVAVIHPVQDAWVDGTLAVLKGTQTDNHRVGPVFYAVKSALNPSIFDGKADPDAYRTDTATAWKEVTVLGIDWNDNIPLTGTDGIGEGRRYLYVAAFDAAGNLATNKDSVRIFGVDYTLPYIDDWAPRGIVPIEGSYYAGGPYGFSFNAKDSNELKSVDIRREGVAVTGGLSIGPITAGTKNAAVTLDHTGVNGGIYPYVIEIRDVGNKENNLENTGGPAAGAFKQITVRVDTEGPALSVSAPAENTPPVLTSDQLQVRGIAPDSGIPTGVRVYYAIDTTAAKPESGKPDASGTLSGWTLLDTGAFTAGTTITLANGMENEGERYIHFIAYDQLGNQAAPVDRKFFVDNYAPQINGWASTDITVPGGLQYLKYSSYVFEFTAHDTNGLKDVRITRARTRDSAGSDTYAAPELLTSAGLQPDPVQGNYTITKTATDSTTWAIRAEFNGQADGHYVYGIEIEDIAGRVNPANNTDLTKDGAPANAFKAFDVRVDTTGPTVTITNPAADALLLAQELIAVGDAIDALTMEDLKVWYLVDEHDANATNAPADPSNPAASGWTAAEGNWRATKSLAGQPEGYLYLHLIAYDKLLNPSAVVHRRFSLDYSPPHIQSFAFTPPSTDPGAPTTLPGDPIVYAKPAYGFTFTAKDTNALSSVIVTRNGTALAGADIVLAPVDTQTVNVTVNLTSQAEGTYNYIIVITDTAGRQNVDDNNTPPDTTDDHKTFTVRVDTTGPLLTVTKPVLNYSIANNQLETSGNAIDMGIPENVEVYYTVINSTDPAPAIPATRADAATDTAWAKTPDASWNTTISLGSSVMSSEGEKRIHFVAYDQLNNSTDANRAFHVDMAAPHIESWNSADITLTQPSVNLLNKNNFDFEFVAQDTNALQSVTITRGTTVLLNATGAETGSGIGYTYAVTPNTINPTKEWTVAVHFTGQVEGNYVYGIAITDSAGKVNPEDNFTDTAVTNAAAAAAVAFKTFNVRLDWTGPVLAFTDPPVDNSSVSGSTVTIGGTAVDALTPAGVTVWYRIDSSSATPSLPSGVASGDSWDGWTRADGGADWYKNAAIPTPIVEGQLYAYAVAYDQLGNSGAIKQKPFYVDISPPYIDGFSFTDVATIDGMNFGKKKYSFTFKARDSNALQSVKVSIDGTVLLNVTAPPSTGDTGVYSYTVTPVDSKEWDVIVSLTGQDQPEGSYVFDIEVKDVTGKENALNNNTPSSPDDDYKTFTVQVDTVGPVLDVKNPIDNAPVSEGQLNVNGTAADDTTIDLSVWYKVDATITPTPPASAAAAAADPDWKLAPGGAVWSQNDPTSLAALGEGERYVHFVAFDKPGNRSAVTTTITIFYDTNPPYMESWAATNVTDINGSYYAKGDYTLGFNARDTNALDSLEIKKTAGGTTTTLTESVDYTVDKSDSTNKSWPVSLAITGPSDGSVSYEFVITDTRGKLNTLDNLPGVDGDAHKRISIKVDKTGPVISVEEPATNHSITNDQLKINGDAIDTGIPENVEVYYTVTNSTDPAPTIPATRAAAAVDTAWMALPAPWNTTITLDSSVNDEGKKLIHFVAYDQLDNWALSTRTFYVDFAAPHIQTWTSTDITLKQPAINLLNKKNFVFDFVAQDTNALQSVTITRTRQGENTETLVVDGTEQTDAYGGKYIITRTETDAQNWEYEASFTDQADGDYVYGIEIRDIVNKVNSIDNDPVPANAYKTFNVRVDTTGPVVAIITPTPDLLVRSDELIAVGSATDATIEDLKVWYVVDTNATIAVPVDPSDTAAANGWEETTDNWKATADLSGQPDGYLYLHVIAYDKLLNASAVQNRRFSVDTKPPQILDFGFTGSITTFADDPVVYATPAYGFTFKANDSNALSSVVVTKNGTVLSGSDIILSPAAPFPAGTKTVNVTVSLAGQADGNYPYIIEITDTAGQQNAENNSTEGVTTDDHKTFTLRVDTTGPVLGVDNPGGDVEISGTVLNVNGTATDSTTNGLTVWYLIDNNDATGAPSPTGNPPVLPGWIEAPGGVIWSKNDDTSLASLGEGTRYVHFAGLDKLGNVSSTVTHRKIYYDANPPYMKDWATKTVDVVEIGGSYYAKGSYTLGFNAVDSNALASLEAKRTVGGITTTLSEGVQIGYTLTINRGNSMSWPVSLELINPSDGNVSYEFVITDTRAKKNTLDNQPGAGVDAHKQISVRVDQTGPNLSVAEPYANQSITNNQLKISGVATDTGIPELVPVYYRVTNGTGSVTAPATRAAAVLDSYWTLATADASWDTTITLGAGVNGEGEKRIHFVAYDQLDNSTLVSRAFYVDSAAPHIDVWTPTDNITLKQPSVNLLNKDNFGFSFVAKDTNALANVKVSRKDGANVTTELLSATGAATGSGTGYAYTVSPNGDNTEWTVVVTLTGQTDDNYEYGIEITDIAGKVNRDDNAPVAANAYKTFTVRVDTVGPVLVFNSPEDNSTVSGSTITIGGTAVDALTPAGVTVWYAIDGSPTIGAPSSPPSGDPLALSGWTRADGSADWYKNATIDSPVEGLLYVHVVAYDQLGNRSLDIKHKPFYVDISPPVIDAFSFTNVTPDAGVNFAGNAYSFTFKAKDSNAMKSVKVSRGGAELVAVENVTSTLTGSGTGYSYTVTPDTPKEWTVTLNFTGQADGNYAFNIEVKDIANRENALDNSTAAILTDDYKTFGVRVDTTGPVLNVVDPVANTSATGSKLYISGTALDDLTADGVEVYYIIDAVSNTPAPADKAAAVADWKNAPGGAYWSHNADLLAGSEGYRYLHVIAYDKRGNASGTSPVHRTFFVDVNPPSIDNWTTTGINFASTPYYAGKDYAISFSAKDSNTLAGGNPADSQSLVTITRNGIALAEGTQSGYTLAINRTNDQTWPVTLTLTNQADGNYSYSIEIRDATGKENTLDNNTGADLTDDHKSFTIVVDSTPPNTALTMAPATVGNDGQDFVLANPGLLRQDNVNGVIEFAASAMDASGLEGVKWFIIPQGEAFNLTAATAQSLYEDSRGVSFAAGSYIAMTDTTALTDTKLHTLYILAKDKAGNVGYTTGFPFYVDQRTDRPVITLTNMTDENPAVGNAFIVRGTVKDDDGVDPASIKINLNNGAAWYDGSGWVASAVDLAPDAVTGSGRELSFSYTLPAMSDGPGKRVIVKASDLPSSKTGWGDAAYNAANAAKTGQVEKIFDLDTTAPVITVTQPIDSTYKGADAFIDGTLTEMHPDVFRLNIDGGTYINHILSPAAGDLVLNWNSVTGVGTWTYKLPITTLSVGLHTVTLEAVDKAGLSTTVLWRFYVDNTGPVISFRIDEVAYPVWGTIPGGLNVLREGGLELKGDFRDDFSAVFTDNFEYRFDNETTWQTTTGVTAAIANPGMTPSWTLFLENSPPPFIGVIPDGPHRVQIRVKDVLENTTTSAWIGFRVDTKDPEIINILPSEANAVFGATGDPVFTLTGTASDANLSGLTLTLNGGTTTTVTVPSGASSVNFSHAVTATVFNALAQGSHRFAITATDEAGRSKTVEWNFIKDTEAPTIEWSNLNDQTGDNSSLFQDPANLKIMGVARDLNGVHTLTGVIDKWSGSAWTEVEGTFDLVPGDETVKNWSKNIADLTVTPLDGLYRITLNATDRGGNAMTAQSREFRVDLAMPVVAIDTGSGAYPLQSFYNGKGTAAAPIGSGPMVISGTASDANGISGVTAMLSGSGAPAWATATAAYNSVAGTWEVTVPHENPGDASQKLPQGGYTLNITATDGAGRTNTATGTFTFDSLAPSAVIDLPVKYARVTGSVAIRGSNNDSGSGVASVWYQHSLADTTINNWREVIFDGNSWNGGLYSWNYTFATTNYIGTSYGTEVSYNGTTVTPTPGSGLWDVPFKIKVIDQAGNEAVIDDYSLLIDQFGDIPRVEISNPISGAILGGRVYISGTASDNNYINRIQYRVKPNPTGLPTEWDGIGWNDAGSGGYLTGTGIGPNVTWQFDINGMGEYNPASGEGMRPVLVQVRAFDAPYGYPNSTAGKESDPVSVLIYFDAGVPRIGEERVANRVSAPIPFPTPMDDTNSIAYTDGLQVSKTFVFEASIQDDSGLESIQYWLDGISSIPNSIGTAEVVAPDIKTAGAFIVGRKYMIDTVGSTDWLSIGANSNTHGATFTATGPGSGTGTAYEANTSQEFVYKLRIAIPSDTLPAYTDKTGRFTINIMAFDNSSPQLRADKSYSLQIDNFYPFGTYTSPNVAAGWYNLRGTARDFDTDSGPIQGLDKVVVYFSRAGTFIPLKEPGSTIGNDGHLWNGTTQEVKIASTAAPGTVTFPADQYSGIFIDRDEQGAGLDQDADGYEEAWFDNGSDKVWSARFNTLQLKDGPVTVHYVIFDKAGNATYYEYTVFIKNHAPAIISVTLGTDIFGDQTIGGTRLYTTGYFTNPAFVARNQRLSFNVAKVDGNGAAHYRITNVAQQQIAANTIVAGEIYTIAVVGSTDWVNIGAPDNNVGTTFVATSNGGGDGQAYKYNPVSGAVVKAGDVTSGGGNETGNVVFSAADFNNIPDAGEAYFLIKIWDTTVASGPEDQQLSDMVVVRVKIENNDAVVPTSRLYDLSPYAKNQSRYDIVTTLSNAGPGGIGEDQNMRFGGLYMDNNAISGHVEPRGNPAGTINSAFLEEGIASSFTVDTVSGKVILRGYARDNQRISEIQVKFGSAAAIKIIQTDATPATTSAGHFRALESVSGVTAWVYDDLSLDEHLVEWAYLWDTQTTSGMAVVGNITVQAISRDARVSDYGNNPYTLNPNSSATVNQSAANNLNYNTIAMAAAPYITSLARGVNYNTLRTKQGWNSFRRSSGTGTLEANEEVVANGFNLSLSGGTGTTLTIKGAATTLSTQTVNRVTLNLPNTAETGAFVLSVSSIQAVNNRNNNANSWNKEASAAVEGSALWNDDRNVHVWQTNNTNTGTGETANRGYFVGSEKPIHPAMTKHPTTGVLYASWSEYKTSQAHYGRNNSGRTQIYSIYDPPEHTDIHFSTNISATIPVVAYNANVYSNGGWLIGNAGGLNIYDVSAGAAYANGGNAYVAEHLVHEQMLAQFENQRVVVRGTGIHVSYYDTDTKSLKYWYNTSGTNVIAANYTNNTTINLGGNNYPNNRWINIDGGFDGNDMLGNNRVVGYVSGGTAGNNTNVAISAATRGAANGDVGSTSQAGEYSAVDLTSDGHPVIAYYDVTNQTVKLAYSTAAIPLATTQWRRQNVLAGGDPNYMFSGKYISMRIDNRAGMQNRIHMVFSRTSTGNLIYVTGTQATAGGPYTFQPSVIIDSVGNVGKWADLSLDANGNPWVSYIDTSRVDSFDGVKMAFCLTSAGTTTAVDASDTTGLRNPDNWEVMNMPTIYNVADKRTSIENWDNIGTGTNQQFWSAAIGYASDDFFRIGYYIKP